MNLTTALVVLAVIVLVMVRRYIGEPLQARRLIVIPLVLIAFGGLAISKIDFAAAGHHPVTDGVALGISALVAVAGGILRGLTVKVYVQNGHVWYRYTLVTIATWAVLIALRVGQSLAGHAFGADADVLAAGMALFAGLSFLGESAIVGRRAFATGAPFAPRGAREAARVGAGIGR